MDQENAKRELENYGKIKSSIKKLKNNAKFAELMSSVHPKNNFIKHDTYETNQNRNILGLISDKNNSVAEIELCCMITEITLELLPDEERNLLERYYVKGDSTEKISRDIHLSVSRVYQLLDHAIDRYAFCRGIVEYAKN